ncbi:MAG: ATP-binding protein [Alphaproteobacteria bacterium]|nr:ATP-binding protein [Alphaproteobacteria bacterium]
MAELPSGSYPLAEARGLEPKPSALIAQMAVGGVDYLRNAVELQKAVIDSIPATVALIDGRGTIVAVNESWKAFARANGYEGEGFGIGSNYIGVCRGANDPSDEAASVASGIQKVLSGYARVFELEYPCHDRERQRWFKLMVMPLKAEDFHGGIVFHLDITDRKLAEISALEARDAAVAASEDKSLFIASASHEFRTPLTSIMGFAEMAQRSADASTPAQQVVCIEEIRRSSEHLLRLVNDLMDLSKAEVCQFELDDRPIDLKETAEAALRMVGPQASANGVTLELKVADRLPRMRGDEQRLSQIALNLLSNAIKFTPENGRVEVELCTDGDERLILQVVDSGVGIPAEDIERVLEPFGRSDHERERNPEGTGLGLPTVKRLVEAHGGCFRLESKLGKGTTATAEFPSYRSVR